MGMQFFVKLIGNSEAKFWVVVMIIIANIYMAFAIYHTWFGKDLDEYHHESIV